MTEDDQDLLERIEGLIANAWDDDEHETLIEARERIKDLIAEKEKLQTQYDEMGNAMLKHTGKAAEEIVRLELENEKLWAVIKLADEYIEDLVGHQGAEGFSETTYTFEAKYDDARAALGETK